MWLDVLRRRWFGKTQIRSARLEPKGRKSSRSVPIVEVLEDRTVPTIMLTVSNGNVTGAGGLIADIGIANSTTTQPVIISLASGGTYVLNSVDNTTDGPNGLPVISATSLTIEGNGATIERPDEAIPKGSQGLRIFDFAQGANVVLQDLTIENGRVIGQLPQTPAIPGGNVLPTVSGSNSAGAGGDAANGGDAKGGGIYASGATLILSNVQVKGNSVQGAAGGVGGIGGQAYPYGAGSAGSYPGGAGGDGQDGGDGGKAGAGGNAYGGGIYLNATELTIENGTVISGNTAQGGTGGVGGFGGQGGPGGTGGSGYSADPKGGNGGDGGDGGGGGKGGSGGTGGNASGAGIYALGSTITIVQGSVTKNTANGGQGGIGGFGGPGGTGGAGGAGGPPLSPPPYGTSPGQGGDGGGGGDGGDAGDGGDGGDATGGGIFTQGGSLTLLTASITANQVVAGPGGPAGIPGAGGVGGAGGNGNPTGASGMSGNRGQSGQTAKMGTASDNPNIIRNSAFAPLFLSATKFTFTAGQTNSFIVVTNGYPIPSLSEAGALPAGVTFVDNGDGTGTLSGTPIPGSGGTYALTFAAANGVTPNATQTFTLSVVSSPQITSPSSATFTVGQSASFPINTSGYPIATLRETGQLPAGVSFENDGNGTATLVGKPLPGSGGIYAITITAQNGVLPNSMQTFTLTADEAPTITSATKTVFAPSSADSFEFTALGFPTPTLAESGTLPQGISFVNNGNGTATLSGTPASGSGGFYHLTIAASNGFGSNASQSFTLLVGQVPTIDIGNQTGFQAGQEDSFTISTESTPVAALSESGTLPPGFTFTDNGNGTATIAGESPAGASGSYPLDIIANNGFTTTQPLTVILGQAPSFTNANEATFTVGQSGSFSIATSGTGPISLADEDDLILPSGLSFKDNGDGTATIVGTPAAGVAGSYGYDLYASNAIGSVSQQFTLNIGQGLAITTPNNGSLIVGQSGSITINTTSSGTTPTLTESGSLPQGVSFHDSGNGTATLNGTPAAGTTGNYSISITAHNGISPDFVQNFTLAIEGTPQFTSAASTTFVESNDDYFYVETTGLPEARITESGALPSGVTFSGSDYGSGYFEGTPAAGTSGSYPVTISAINGIGGTVNQSFTLYVGDYTSATSATFQVGQSGSFNVATTGFPTPVSLSVYAYSLPSGLSFTDSGNGTGIISGTPAANTSSNYTVPITISQGSTALYTQDVTIVVDDAPGVASSASATFIANSANTFKVRTYGLPVPSLTESGTLPQGVTFVDDGDGTATLSGTPAAAAEGTYHFTISAANGICSPATQNFTLTVGTGIVFTNGYGYFDTTNFVLGQSNSYTIKTAGSPTASLTESGSLPSGVTFADNGNGTATLSGTPAAGSNYEYQITVAAANGVDTTVDQTFDLLVLQPTEITSGSSANFTVNQSGSFSITTAHDPNLEAPELTETGNLPAGVYFESNYNGTATLSGYPETGTTGSYSITIDASEYGSVPDAIQNFTLNVGSAPAITSAKSANFNQGAAGTFTVTTTGFPTPALTETGTLPQGVTFVDNGNGTATLSGTPAAGTVGTYSVSFEAINGIGSGATQTFSLAIGQAPAITSASSTTFAVGQSGTFTFTSTGSPTPSLTETGSLPGGITFTNNGNGTATLSGTPSAGTAGVYSIAIEAQNGSTTPAEQSFTLDVNDASKITSGNGTSFSIGSMNSFTVATYGFPAPSLTEAGSLPAGVTFVDNGNGTATLSGKPTSSAIGYYDIAITAHNSSGGDAIQTFSLIVGQEPAIASSATAIFGVQLAGSFTIAATGSPFASIAERGALPAGITFKDNGNGTATLSGTPAIGTSGLYPLAISAANGIEGAATQNLLLEVGSAPTIASAGSASFGVGGPGSFTVQATGLPAPALSETGALPNGLSFVDNGNGTATLSGTPAAGSAGTYKVTLTANNGAGANATQSFTIAVGGVAPAITSIGSATFTAGQADSFTVTTAGTPTAALSESGTLPAGISFKNNGNGTATLSGTPAFGSGGIYSIAFTAANGTSSSATQIFALTVDEAPEIVSASTVSFASGLSDDFAIGTVGFPAASFTESGTLPSGVTFADNGNGTASLSGTPTIAADGTYTISLMAQNGIGSAANQSFTLTVENARAPTFTSAAADSLTVGQAANFTVTATGFPTPNLQEAGVLPAGLWFAVSGDGTATISGTPASGTAGIYALALTAANGSSSPATQNLILTVQDAPRVTSTASAKFTSSDPDSFTVTTYGFPTPTLTEVGALPTGVTFVDNGDGTATLSGTPPVASDGTYTISIDAHNGQGAGASQTFVLLVAESPTEAAYSFTSNPQTAFTVGKAGSYAITTSSNSFKLTETGTLPSGVTFKDDGNGTATLSGTPAAGTSGTYDFTVTAADSTDSASVTFVLTIDGPPSFTSATSATFYPNEYESFVISTVGIPDAEVSEVGILPNGIYSQANPEKGTLTLEGDAEPGTEGTYPLVITASNAQGSATEDFTLIIGSSPSSSFTFVEGESGSAQVTSELTGSPKLTEAGTLPAGVSFADDGNGTGTLSGTPAVGTSGTYYFTVSAAGSKSTQIQSYALLVADQPTITSKATDFFGIGRYNSFSVAARGYPSPNLTESGTLPQGVTFYGYGGSGYLEGTPATGSAGTYDITISASNGETAATTQDFTLIVGQPLAIVYPSSTTFTVDEAGSIAIDTSGGGGLPITLKASGALPEGLSFADNGNGTASVAGVPELGTGGYYSITVTATNGVSTVAQGIYIDVNQTATPAFSSVAAATFVPGYDNAYTISTSDSAKTITEVGALPSGVSFADNYDGTATIEGMPASGTNGTYPLVLTATASNGNASTQDFTLAVGPGLAFTSGTSGSLTVGTSGSITLSAIGTKTPTLTAAGDLPTGVTFSNSGNGTATLSGTPAADTGGLYYLTITAHDGADPAISESYVLTVDAAPTITSPPTFGLVAGSYDYGTDFEATGYPYPTITESGALPSGMTFESSGSYAYLSGTPASGSSGTYDITLTASSGFGSNATQNVTLYVGPLPSITSSSSPTFTVGQSGSFTVTTSGSPVPAILDKYGTLPAGLTFVDNGNGTATISGTPAAGTGGTSYLDLQATNAIGSSNYQYMTLTIDEGPQITSAPSATFAVGQGADFFVATRGYPSPTVTEVGNLPAGVTLESYGTFYGTPAAGTAGTYPIVITATDGTVGSVTQNFTLTVDQVANVTSAPAATFSVGQSNTFTVTTAAGSPTDELTEVGNLPSGISFTDNGNGTATLSGTPATSAAGAYDLMIVAHNGVSFDDDQNFILYVNRPPSFASAASAKLYVGQSSGSFTIVANGSPVPSLTEAGTLPSGVTFMDNGDGTATIAGTPAAGSEGTYTLAIAAANGVGTGATQNFALTMAQGEAPAITSGDSDGFSIGKASSFTIASTGTPTPALTVSGVLPSGVTFEDNGNGTATLGGTPAAGSGGTYDLTIEAANGIGSDATQNFTLTIAQAPSITSASAATFVVGQSDTFAVTAIGFPTPTLTETGSLPAGVTFVDNGNGTATLSGTAALPTGTFKFAISASNGNVPAATQNFTLAVSDPPQFTSANSATFSVGKSGTFAIATVPGVPATTTVSESGRLPKGIAFKLGKNGTATLSGIPAAGTGGNYPIVLTAANSSGKTAQSYTLTVDQAPAITSSRAASFALSQSGSFTVVATGFPAATISAVGLPSGLALTNLGNGTATIGGTPAIGTLGSHTVQLTASNGIGNAATQTLTVTVDEAPAFSSVDNVSFTVGKSGSFTIATSPGVPTTTTLTESGRLPQGVAFKVGKNGTATLSGTPAAGSGRTYNLILTASNGATKSEQSFTLTIDQTPTFTNPRTATFVVGTSKTFAVTTTGFPAAALSAIGLPAGLRFMDEHNGTGTITGTPAAGTFGVHTIVLMAFNGIGTTATQTLTLTVDQAPSITSANSAAFLAGQSNTFTVETAGFPIATLSEKGTLPKGVTFLNDKNGTATLKGVPVAGTHGSYTFTIYASNGILPEAIQTFTLTVS